MKNLISIWNFTNTVMKRNKIIWEFQIRWGGTSPLKPLRRYLIYFRGTHWQSSLSRRLLAFYTWMNRVTECLYGVQCRSRGISGWLKGCSAVIRRSCPPSSGLDYLFARIKKCVTISFCFVQISVYRLLVCCARYRKFI